MAHGGKETVYVFLIDAKDRLEDRVYLAKELEGKYCMALRHTGLDRIHENMLKFCLYYDPEKAEAAPNFLLEREYFRFVTNEINKFVSRCFGEELQCNVNIILPCFGNGFVRKYQNLDNICKYFASIIQKESKHHVKLLQLDGYREERNNYSEIVKCFEQRALPPNEKKHGDMRLSYYRKLNNLILNVQSIEASLTEFGEKFSNIDPISTDDKATNNILQDFLAISKKFEDFNPQIKGLTNAIKDCIDCEKKITDFQKQIQDFPISLGNIIANSTTIVIEFSEIHSKDTEFEVTKISVGGDLPQELKAPEAISTSKVDQEEKGTQSDLEPLTK